MGEIAAQYADYIVLTTDNPRYEDEQKILSEIEQGVQKKKNCEYVIIADRKKAIQEALAHAQKNDVVLILGKGHEEYIIRNDKKTPFSDRQVIEHMLRGEPVNANRT